MSPDATTRQTATLRAFTILLAVNVASSVVHYIDNVVRWGVYADPKWLSPGLTDSFWFVMTPFALAAWYFAKRGDRAKTAAASYAYGVMGLLTLGHYLIAPPWRTSLSINATILVESFAAAALLVFTWRAYSPPLEGYEDA